MTCNGQPAALGHPGCDGDEVRIDGEFDRREEKADLHRAQQTGRHHLHHRSPYRGQHHRSRRAFAERIFPIGRLDRDSEGLILLTNNGDIVNEILRSENNHEKEYIVTVDRPITDLSLKMMAGGVKIMGELTKPCKVGAHRLRVVSHHSHPRIEPADPPHVLGAGLQGAASAARANHEHSPGNLQPGQWRHLTERELAGLLPRSIRPAR